MLNGLTTPWQVNAGAVAPAIDTDFSASIVPKGMVNLLLAFEGQHVRYEQNGLTTQVSGLSAIVIGPSSRRVVARLNTSGPGATIALGYGRAASLLRACPLEFRDRAIPLEDHDRQMADSFRAVLAKGADGVESRLSALLRERTVPEPSSTVMLALEVILRAKGAVAPGKVAAEVGVSSRTLQRTFENELGMPPSAYVGLARVAAARRIIAQGRFRSLAELAVTLGYFDQAHFTKHFSAVAGVPPGRAKGLQDVAFLQD